MTTINPEDCKPDEAYAIRVGSRETVGIRLGMTRTTDQWITTVSGPWGWYSDDDITVLHRLVPEGEEKVLDVPMQSWDVLRATISAGARTSWRNAARALADAGYLVEAVAE